MVKERCRPVGTGTGEICTSTEPLFTRDILFWYINDNGEIRVVDPTHTLFQIDYEVSKIPPFVLLKYFLI